MEGAEEAFAVDGTPGACLHGTCTQQAWIWAPKLMKKCPEACVAPPPPPPPPPPSRPAADSVMLALNGPLLRNPAFNLVVSGINRGDNCGLHTIYSGTVGGSTGSGVQGSGPAAAAAVGQPCDPSLAA